MIFKKQLKSTVGVWTTLSTFLLLFVLCYGQGKVSAQDTENAIGKSVYVTELNENIFPSAWRLIRESLTEAEDRNMDYYLLDLNTYGGLVDVADSIRTRLLKAKIPTLAFIDNNAASAGALISIACDSIFMVKGAQIGAATVVSGGSGEAMPDKYQSYMRATMRSTAEAKGRDPLIAEGMVDQRISIPGLVDTSQVVTFTTQEARKYGFCDGVFDDRESLLAYLGANPDRVVIHKTSFLSTILGYLQHPMATGIFLMMIFSGIYFELQTPGIGFPIMAATIGAILYFAPNYMDGLADYWEIGIFVLGMILIGVEVFAIPGFGLIGILGGILFLSGLVLSLLRNDMFDFSMADTDQASLALVTVLGAMVLSLIAFFFFGGKLADSAAASRLILKAKQDTDEGYTVGDKRSRSVVDREGLAVTDLRLTGIVEIDGERYDAISEGNYIPKGKRIKVLSYRSIYLVVMPLAE